jgi:pimeloyl-ACP methyl ester carboxylesterase
MSKYKALNTPLKMKKVLLGIGIFLLIPIILVAFRKDHRIAYEVAIEQFETPNSHFYNWNGIQLHYVEKGEGIPVVLLHGFGGSFDNWRKLMEAFPEGYRLIAADLPGFGLSEYDENLAPEVDLTAYYTQFTADLLTELKIDTCYLIGNSLGGFLAWETTLRNEDKVKKLVLLNSAGYSADDIKATLIQATKSPLFKGLINKGVPKPFVRYAANRVIGDTEHYQPDSQRLASFYGLMNKKGTLEMVQKIGAADHTIDTTRIPNIKVPTLIVWGDNDHIVPVEHAYKFKRDIPNSKLLIYKGSGHVPMMENTERLLADILDFFNTPTILQDETALIETN